MTTHTLTDASRWSRYVPMLLLAALVLCGALMVKDWLAAVRWL